MILLLAVLALTFFKSAPVKIKFVIFVILFVGVAGFAATVMHQTQVVTDREAAHVDTPSVPPLGKLQQAPAPLAPVAPPPTQPAISNPPAGRLQPKLTETILASISVHNGPLRGQDWRASENFSISTPPGIGRLKWIIVGAGSQAATFSVAKDQRFTDPKIFENVHSGHTTAPVSEVSLYVGGVSGASEDFTIKVYGE